MVDCVSLALVMRVCAPTARAIAALRDAETETAALDIPTALSLHVALRALDDACELSAELAEKGKLPAALKAQTLAEELGEDVVYLLSSDEITRSPLLAELDWDRVDTVVRDLGWYMEEDYKTTPSGRGNIDQFRDLLTQVRRELEKTLYA